MKIKIAYKPEDEKQVAAVMAALLRILPGAKVHKSERYAPFIHIYITA